MADASPSLGSTAPRETNVYIARVQNGVRFHAHERTVGEGDNAFQCVEVRGVLRVPGTGQKLTLARMCTVDQLTAYRGAFGGDSADPRDTALDLLIPDMVRELVSAMPVSGPDNG